MSSARPISARARPSRRPPSWRRPAIASLIEGSRRLLVAACAEDAVRRSADPDATPADINRCEAYLTSVLAEFPREYSSALVTDAEGVARCASLPTAIGMNFADREIFRLVRDTKAFAAGRPCREPSDAANGDSDWRLPILQDGQFRGMCALGLSLRTVGELVTRRPAAGRSRWRWSIATAARSAATRWRRARCRSPPRLAAAIVGGRRRSATTARTARSTNSTCCRSPASRIFAVGARAGVAAAARRCSIDWGGFAAVVLALAGALLAVWLGADRWCVRPLRYIQNFADRVARGEDIELAPPHPWAPEMASVGEGVRAMAEAIASREEELRAGLEQRDHMLREIHHRVKNNLQMISSLLNLQAGEIRSPRIRRFFGDAQNRVLTLSILHRHLYERSSWALVDFQQFISDLVRQISVARRGTRSAAAALSHPRADHGGRAGHRHSHRPDRDRGGQQRARPQLRRRCHARDPHRGGRQGAAWSSW